MNKLLKSFSVFVILVFFTSFNRSQTTQAAPVAIDYEILFYRSLDDRLVANFVASNHCTSSGKFQLCKSAGIAMQVDRHRIIEQIYLYVDGTNGFSVYGGELPFGITHDDTMGIVEQKLGYPRVPQRPDLGWEPRLPDSGRSPDHIHYWATYERLNLTIVYNSPIAQDKNAGIHMILVHFEPRIPPLGRVYLL